MKKIIIIGTDGVTPEILDQIHQAMIKLQQPVKEICPTIFKIASFESLKGLEKEERDLIDATNHVNFLIKAAANKEKPEEFEKFGTCQQIVKEEGFRGLLNSVVAIRASEETDFVKNNILKLLSLSLLSNIIKLTQKPQLYLGGGHQFSGDDPSKEKSEAIKQFFYNGARVILESESRVIICFANQSQILPLAHAIEKQALQGVELQQIFYQHPDKRFQTVDSKKLKQLWIEEEKQLNIEAPSSLPPLSQRLAATIQTGGVNHFKTILENAVSHAAPQAAEAATRDDKPSVAVKGPKAQASASESDLKSSWERLGVD